MHLFKSICVHIHVDLVAFQSVNLHFVFRLVHTISQGSSCWFVDDSQNIKS